MKKFPLSSDDELRYAGITEAEKQAWLYPLSDSYHSYHLERMGEDCYRIRDSRAATFYIGTFAELTAFIFSNLKCRKPDLEFIGRGPALSLLNQQEIDDLLSDI